DIPENIVLEIEPDLEKNNLDMTNNDNDNEFIDSNLELPGINKTNEDKENYETIPIFQKIHNTTSFEIGDYVKLDCANGVLDTCFCTSDIGLLESSNYPELTKILSIQLSLHIAAIKQSSISI
ncbi:18524_t:CDS:2, partial [Dentiscutata erythropus]